jgi:DNA primase
MSGGKEAPKKRRDFSPLIEVLLADFSVWKESDERFRAACPYHGGDNRTTFSIGRSGFFRCFKCEASGGMTELYAHLKNLSLAQAREALAGETLPVFYSMQAVTDKLAKHTGQAEKGFLREADIVPYLGLYPRYLLNRGFSKKSIRLFDIGYDETRSKIVLPVRNVEGRLVGITYRIDYEDDDTQPAKYWHDNFSKALHLYGLHLIRKERRIYLVEGQLDAVRMRQLGFPAAAIMGSALSREQADLVNADEVVLAFDNDEAGEKATRLAIKELSGRGKRLLVMQYPGKDPGDLQARAGITYVPWHRWILGSNRTLLPFSERYIIQQEALKAALWKKKKR